MEDWLVEYLESHKDNIFQNQTLRLVNRGIQQIDWFPDNAYHIHLGHNQLTSIPSLHRYVKLLDLERNQLQVLPMLPEKLQFLNVSWNQTLSHLPELPNELEVLKLNFCNLTKLPDLPQSLKYLYCQCNQLETLPQLPDHLEYLYLSGNPLVDLPYLPESLKVLDLGDNEFLRKTYGTLNLQRLREKINGRLASRKTKEFKEELMMECWHPRRVWKLVEAGIDTDDM